MTRDLFGLQRFKVIKCLKINSKIQKPKIEHKQDMGNSVKYTGLAGQIMESIKSGDHKFRDFVSSTMVS